ncbi:MAG: hypothetical protein U5K56_04455 [Halioglobus sp.]|nr:hypothetical protein [Halioglobus sp.]
MPNTAIARPYLKRNGERGDMFVLGDELPPIPVGIIAAAGKDPIEIRADGVLFEDMHKGGWDPDARIADQDRDRYLGRSRLSHNRHDAVPIIPTANRTRLVQSV